VSGFENFGVRQDLDAWTRMECGICWAVYDPSLGDPVAQVPPGTAFADLPADWTCPNCDAVPTKFMVVEAGT
jgi:rubredoxin